MIVDSIYKQPNPCASFSPAPS